MKKVEEKFGNKAHYNSVREPIHFAALLFSFFRSSLSLSHSLVWVHSFDFIIVFIALYFRVSNWLSSPKQKAHFNFIILFVAPARPKHAPPPYAPALYSIEISHKKGIKAEASVDCEQFFLALFQSRTRLATSLLPPPLPLPRPRPLFSAHSSSSHSELINNFFPLLLSLSLALCLFLSWAHLSLSYKFASYCRILYFLWFLFGFVFSVCPNESWLCRL